MRRDPLPLGKNLDGSRSCTHPDLLTQKLMGDRVIMAMHVDMIIQRHDAQLPFGVDISCLWKGLQGRPIQPGEQIRATGSEVTRDFGIDPCRKFGDGGVQVVQREEPLVAQPPIVPKARL